MSGAGGEPPRPGPRVRWQRSGAVLPTAGLAALAVLAAVAVGRSDLVVFAAPLLGALAGAWWEGEPDAVPRVRAGLSAARVVEGDPVTLDVAVEAPAGAELLDVSLEVGPGLRAEQVSVQRDGPAALRARWELHTVGWGRSPSRLRLRMRGSGGLLHGEATYPLPVVTAFPVGEALDAVPRPLELPDLLGGMHVGRRRGSGVEFAGIRPYLPGDPLRAVNWPASARRGGLHVTERLTEQSATVVAMIDASGDLAQPGRSTLEVSVQGALAVTRAAVLRGDRAGVLALGGAVRWMAPGLGGRHLHRVVEALVDAHAGGGTAPADVSAFPRALLPTGAAVVVFSPLVHDRVPAALADLARRGHGVVVVDVLRTEPRPRPDSGYDAIAVRMWRLRRAGVRDRLAELGVPVLPWPAGADLESVLRPLARRPLVGGSGR